jgi:hypothetical protein
MTTLDRLTASDDGSALLGVDFPAAGFTLPASAPAPETPATAPETPTAAAAAPLTREDLTAALAGLVPTAAAPAPAPAPEVTAGRPIPSGSSIPAVPRSAGSDLTLARVAGMIAAANRGEIDGQSLRAALAVSTTTELAGLTPPAYIAELAGLVKMGRPTASAIRNRALPPTGMKVTYPSWKTLPTVGTQAAEHSQPSSTKAEIELLEGAVVTEAGANELSVQAVDRTDPSAIAALLEALAELYSRRVNVGVSTDLIVAAGAAKGIKGLAFGEAVAALLAGLDPTKVPAGGLFVAVAWDYYATTLVGMKDADKPAWWDGKVTIGGVDTAGATDDAGLTVVVDGSMPKGQVLLGARNGATLWEDPAAPVNVRTVDLGVLSVDVGLYGYHALTIEYPGAFALGKASDAPTVAPAPPAAKK